MQDQKIVNLIKEGNELGFVKLADKYEKLLFYIAKGILGSRTEDIEECVNDTYMKLWNNIDKYDINKASLKTYLKIIVRNTAINRLRDLSRHENNQLSDDISEIAKYYADNSQDIEDRIFAKESIETLNELIKSLKPKDKEIIIRKYFYLQSSKQIAKAMKMTVTAVDSKASRRRKKLKKEFDKEIGNITQKG
ncbi:MAG: sigma-70 family RNA polymerase sigma factor [Clostridiales bacterium]|nr:sigma-70 family RNA polymerase sigma factor [Clostridiales bacterium]